MLHFNTFLMLIKFYIKIYFDLLKKKRKAYLSHRWFLRITASVRWRTRCRTACPWFLNRPRKTWSNCWRTTTKSCVTSHGWWEHSSFGAFPYWILCYKLHQRKQGNGANSFLSGLEYSILIGQSPPVLGGLRSTSNASYVIILLFSSN